jgi:inhibitor of cysteine peptidase
MSRRAWWIGIASGAALMAAAGSARAAARTVTIGYSYDGGLVNLAVGDELEVRVGSTPGTGYSWSVTMNDPAVLEPVGKPIDEKSAGARPGTPGSRVFRFRAAKAGSSSLGLVYERPWEKNTAPARLFRVLAVVEPSVSGKPLALSESDAGSKIFLLQGETLSVRLPSNPSTGYGWAVTRTVTSILKSEGEPRLETPVNATPGAPGFQVFEFTVAGAGSAPLELSYRRPSEKDRPAAKTWTIFVAAAGIAAPKAAK